MDYKIVKLETENINSFFWDKKYAETIISHQKDDIFIYLGQNNYDGHTCKTLGLIKSDDKLYIKDGFLMGKITWLPSFIESSQKLLIDDTPEFEKQLYLLPSFWVDGNYENSKIKSCDDIYIDQISLEILDKNEVDSWREPLSKKDVV